MNEPSVLPPCLCRDLGEVHTWDQKHKRRTWCTAWHDGHKCGCRQYQPVVSHD